MTGGSDPEAPSPPAPDSRDGPPPDPATPDATAPGTAARSAAGHRYLGLTTFTIEGRQAPGLFVVGWIATVIGVGFLAIVTLGIPGIAGVVIFMASVLGLSAGTIMLAGAQTIERRAAAVDDAGPAPLLVVIAGFTTYVLLALVAGIALVSFAASIPIPVGDLVSVLVQLLAFAGVVRVAVRGPGVLSWPEMGWVGDRAAVIRGLVGGSVFAGPVILLTAVVAALAVGLAGVSPPSPLPPTGTAAGLILHLVAGAVIGPVSEELLFRGYALTAWRRLVGTRGAILRSSIVFVVAHMLLVSGGRFEDTIRLAFVAGVARLPVAFTLGWLFVRTGSIWGPIGLHAAFNAILIVIGEAAAGS